MDATVYKEIWDNSVSDDASFWLSEGDCTIRKVNVFEERSLKIGLLKQTMREIDVPYRGIRQVDSAEAFFHEIEQVGRIRASY